MSPLDALRALIPGFPGYSSEADRRRSDALLRSLVGEALAALRERLAPIEGDLGARCDALVMQAGFVNQQAFNAFEYATLDGKGVEAIAQADLAAAGLAGRAAEVDRQALPGFLDEISAAFDRRYAAMNATAGPR